MKIVTKRTIKKECWNLDNELVKWLNSHLRVYLQDADKNVDLTFHTFWIGDEKITQQEAIRRLIVITDYLLKHEFTWDEEELFNVVTAKDEMYNILKEIHFTLWW